MNTPVHSLGGPALCASDHQASLHGPALAPHMCAGDEAHGWSDEASFRLPGGYPVRSVPAGLKWLLVDVLGAACLPPRSALPAPCTRCASGALRQRCAAPCRAVQDRGGGRPWRDRQLHAGGGWAGGCPAAPADQRGRLLVCGNLQPWDGHCARPAGAPLTRAAAHVSYALHVDCAAT